jgi:acylphosphatase
MSETICRHLRISGRVQGVGYRWSLCAEANGSACRAGYATAATAASKRWSAARIEAVDALTLWAQRGPSMARVDSVVCGEGNAAEIGAQTGFHNCPRAERSSRRGPWHRFPIRG